MSDKLAWWLIQAHSSERWFQFEFTYQLHLHFAGRYTVVCEKARQDIAVLDPQSQCQVAAIELKVLGNWWSDGNTFQGIKKDVGKVDGYPCESLALAIWFLVKPHDQQAAYAWLEKQVAVGKGVAADAALIAERMKSNCDSRFELAAQVAWEPNQQFDKLEVAAFVCRNNVCGTTTKGFAAANVE